MARPRPPGRSLDPASDGGARGMVVAKVVVSNHDSFGTKFGLRPRCGGT